MTTSSTPAAAPSPAPRAAATAADAPGRSAPRSPGSAGALAGRLVGRLGGGIARLFLLVVAVFWLMPTVGLLISSLRTSADNETTGWWTVLLRPTELTVENYRALLSNDAITGSLLNTVLITVPATVLVVAISAFAGYAFAWMDFPGRDWLFLVVIGLLVVPIQIALIPLARLFGTLGIFGSMVGVIAFHVAFGLPFAIFLLRNFFAEVPRELLEAGRLDGAGELRLFVQVILPLAGPAIASLSIFQFLWVWNDMLIALIFADSGSAPITVALQQQVRQFGANFDILGPGAFISMVIPLVIFFAFQRSFIEGVTAGAVK
ncbi:carbohydrate ABC transporter permease [Allostreptomyces psammosilenae]|uniref:Alpha-glucoside transport system permease protein n=1 Tax=Allostreptomyces psammosilenae TaxID=1892865 RepID=A0A852ZW64_9ACTN|nr:carbohydrate ABC transporter permease [Allostreptomyces psammosilenae]NYI06195.1 alpha-glucoside transport system permease protein [Allostreptomyces psammosilenae]